MGATDPLLLGIDVGTSLCKAGLVTTDGRTVGLAHVATPWRGTPTGAEIDLGELFEAVLQAARQAIATRPDRCIVGVGITSLAETGALLDARDRPLAPGLAWFDTRGEAQQAAFERIFGPAALARHTGLSAPRVTSLIKLGWLFGHGVNRQLAHRWLNAAEWIAFRLGAEPVAELSLASRTGLLDQQTQDWWPAALDWLGLSADLMPRLVGAGTCVGYVRPGLLPGADGAVLTIAGHDHLCAAAGVGATQPEDVVNSCGTAVALVRGVAGRLDSASIERLVRAGISVGAHVLDGQQALLTGFAEGFALRRFLRLLGVAEADRTALDQQAAEADTGELRVEGIDTLSASVAGISDDVTPALVWRAALDAVERRLAEFLELMLRETGPHRRVIVVGGWAHNPAVRAAKRAFLGPCVYARVDEAGVRGAALLAGLAAGVFPSIEVWPSCPIDSNAESA